jgi:predicted glycoside hydrolase/deacetylase ChbG (UPF0249 family)
MAYGSRNFRLAAPRVRIITRGDDLGCAHGLNRAMKVCYEKGVLKNRPVLAASPHVEEGARMLAGVKGLCFGLRCDLTSEWDNVRWKPAARAVKAPSLIGRDGTLHQTNEAVWANAKADEALIELRAQLDRARKLGFDIRYADLRMGAAQRVPGLAEKFGPWLRSRRIIDTREIGKGVPNMPDSWGNPARKKQGDYVEQLITALKAAPEGEYLIVHHPGYDDAEIRNLGHAGYPGDSVAHNLNWERPGDTDPRMVRFVKEGGAQPIRYDET